MSEVKLIKYDAMCRAIEAAYDIDEVKDIRDKALAIEVYSRQAKNVDAEQHACEIRLRAERKVGKLLSEMEKAKGGKSEQKLYRSHDSTGNKSLKDMGISKNQSSKWQKLGKIPDEEFEEKLQKGAKPTTHGMIKKEKKEPVETVSDDALWLYGHLLDFSKNGILKKDPSTLMKEPMTDEMKETIYRLIPIVRKWLRRFGEAS